MYIVYDSEIVLFSIVVSYTKFETMKTTMLLAQAKENVFSQGLRGHFFDNFFLKMFLTDSKNFFNFEDFWPYLVQGRQGSGINFPTKMFFLFFDDSNRLIEVLVMGQGVQLLDKNIFLFFWWFEQIKEVLVMGQGVHLVLQNIFLFCDDSNRL